MGEVELIIACVIATRVHVFGLVPQSASQTIISVSLLLGINGCSRVVYTCTPRPHDQLLRSHSTSVLLSLSPQPPCLPVILELPLLAIAVSPTPSLHHPLLESLTE